ncbi:hypothetical protein JTE90_001646 [Oedothorax gibbosus]|uniref:Uncharacterized protein n=1 Tax=Oedothorax gibbosus TaxID=931172 RepID=A0AAV6VPB7_9ARAC|nr:hypothetical protein JTE90_001646 [Oedothorax gibbosus]
MSVEKSVEKDPFRAAKEAEARILKLQAEVNHVKQRIQLSESEERAEIEEYEKKIKENDQEIKSLNQRIHVLQIHKHKGLKGDEQLIAKAFQEHSKEVGIMVGKSGKDAVEILDGKVLDLIKKSNALTHELKVKEKELARLKDQEKDIAWKSYNEFEAEHPESEALRRVRDLENDYQKVEKNLMECQIIRAKYKAIQEQMRQELLDYPKLLEELEDRHRAYQEDVTKLMASEVRAQERRELARREMGHVEAEAARARQEKEMVIAEYSRALRPKQMATQEKSVELRDTEAAEQWRHLKSKQEEELKSYHEAFEKIKEAIGISDINDAESRFLSQKATKEELSELVRKLEQKRNDMQEEVEDLRAKKEAIKGAKLESPQVTLEKELKQAKREQEKQRKRKMAAEAELERIKKLYADVKSGLWQQLQLMEKHLKEEDTDEMTTMPDEDATVIVTKLEDLLEKVFQQLKEEDLDYLKKSLKEEQFIKNIEPTKLVQARPTRKIKPPEEEESSDDEDFEKQRALLKKEAQLYAEMKKKQQGRGRMMML